MNINWELGCSENSSSVIGIPDDLRPAYLYNFRFQHVLLHVRIKQEPEEYVTIKGLCFGKKNMYKPLEVEKIYIQTCSLLLHFDNNVDELSPHLYKYKVVCKALVKKLHSRYHVLLFEKTNVRKGKIMVISHDFCINSRYLDDEELIHICFDVKRFKNKNMNDNLVEHDFYQKLLDSEKYFDVVFQLENSKLRAHKHILHLKCKKINLPLMNDGEMATVYNKVFKPNVIESMLSYVYTGKVKNFGRIAMALLQVIYKYGIDDLKPKCEEVLIFSLDEKNAESILEAATMYDLKALQACAKQFLKWR